MVNHECLQDIMTLIMSSFMLAPGESLALTHFTPTKKHLHSHVNVADRIRQREQERTKMVPGSCKLLFLLEPLGLIEPL